MLCAGDWLKRSKVRDFLVANLPREVLIIQYSAEILIRFYFEYKRVKYPIFSFNAFVYFISFINFIVANIYFYVYKYTFVTRIKRIVIYVKKSVKENEETVKQ